MKELRLWLISGMVILVMGKLVNAAEKKAISDTGLVGYWSFDEGKGDVAKDYSGKGNDGEIINAEWGKGKIGSALQFDGESSKVDCGTGEILNITNEITIMAWVNPLSEKKGDIVRKHYAYAMRIGDQEDLHGYLYINEKFEGLIAQTGYKVGKWSHTALTYDGKKMKLFRDGKVVASKNLSGPIALSAENLYIGGATFPIHAVIDEVKIFNRALSEEEVERDFLGVQVKAPEKKEEEKIKERESKISSGLPSEKEYLFIEAEDFEYTGYWLKLRDGGCSGGNGILVSPQNISPEIKEIGKQSVTVIRIPTPGIYRLWVRSRDFKTDRPGIRRFAVEVNGVLSKEEFGTHGQEGWAWQQGDDFKLPKGDIIIAVVDTTQEFARCDALLLTTDLDYRPPNERDAILQLSKKYRINPVSSLWAKQVEAMTKEFLDKEQWKSPRVVEVLENEQIKLEFVELNTKKEKGIFMRPYIRLGGQWVRIGKEQAEEIYLVVYSPESQIHWGGAEFLPTWRAPGAPIEIKAGNLKKEVMKGSTGEVYQSGNLDWVIPQSYERVGKNAVKLIYRKKGLFGLEITWELEDGKKHAKVNYKITALEEGSYSLGYHGFCSHPLEGVDKILLPYLWHDKRFADRPSLLVDAFTPTPLSLVQFKDSLSGHEITCSLVADPKYMPFSWPNKEESTYGFLIRNMLDEVQPAIFSPVPGSAQSWLKKGQSCERGFYYMVSPEDWFSIYRYTVRNIFKIGDYRRNYRHSLTEAIFNTIDLLMNDEYGGWWKEAKASYQIECADGVTLASPLLPLELYLLTADKDIYYKRAVPAMEYALSRPSPHFSPFTEKKGSWADSKLSGSSSCWSPVVLSSFYMMTRNLTGKFYHTAMAKENKDWKDLLFLYLMTHEEKYLEEAKVKAEDFLKEVYGPHYGPTTVWHNVSFVPDQWRLLDMYEITGEKKYLDAQAEEAKWLLTNVWTQPIIPEGKITIHPGGKYAGVAPFAIPWKGTKRYRLGQKVGVKYYEVEQREIEAWVPSQVGLSFEEIGTYAAEGNIPMSDWAPHLLRLYQHTGDVIFRDYARNAILGRWSNYPGYKINGFTDLYMSPEYPYKGPDVTLIYYHHILPFLAFNIDFLVTEAVLRSRGEIDFPWAVQTGYAWFTSRMYGLAPGNFYGDKDVWLWFKKGLVNIDTYKLNYLTAHSKNKLYLFLMNEENEEVKANISINESLIGFAIGKEHPLTIIKDNAKKETSIIKEAKIPVSVSPKGVIALIIDGVNIDIPIHSFTAKKMDLEKQKESFVDIPNAGKPFGEIHASLIMVEPSSYSAYAFITATDAEIKKAKLYWSAGNDKYQNVEKEEYPFEFSVVNLEPSFPFNFYIEVEDREGKVCNSEKYTLRTN